MADLLGFASILLVCLVTLLIASRWQDIYNIVLIALILKVIFILIGHYIIPLPDSTADAKSFEYSAQFLAKDGLLNVLSKYNGPSPRFISWIIAIPYSLFGQSVLMAQSLSLCFGIGCIFLGWKLAIKLWDTHTAKKVAWTIAFFPSLILYSVLVMREIYVAFFLLVALYGICNWVKTNNFKWIFIAMVGFIGGIHFHGAIIIGLLFFLIIIFLSFVKKTFVLLIKFRNRL